MKIIKKSAIFILILLSFLSTISQAESLNKREIPLIKFKVIGEIAVNIDDEVGLIYENYGIAANAHNVNLTDGKTVKLWLIGYYKDDVLGYRFLTYFIYDKKAIQLEGTPAEIGKKAFEEINKLM